MPQNKRKYQLESLDELLAIAKENVGQLAKEGIEETDWNNVDLYSNTRLADFVERRLLGVNDNNINIEHNINMVPFRLEHTADSPRKRAAEAVAEKYRECYERSTELRFQQQVLDEAQNLLYTKVHAVDNEKRAELTKRNADNRAAYLETTEKLHTYQNFMSSFFGNNIVSAYKEGQAIDQEEADAERRVLQEIGSALPNTPEYDVYRTRAGYEAQQPLPMAPRTATLVMNPNVITDITVDNFPASIHAENPSRLNLEWGASTFDNMMESLYNWDEWKDLKRDGKSLLNTVYLDGRPVTELFPERNDKESYEDYERRVKSEVVAYALEGKGKIDVSPYKKEGNTYGFKEPVPVNVKVNLPEKVSAWKRFLRFFNIKVELKKEKAERISLEDLNHEERLGEVRRNVERIAARENTSQMVRDKIQTAEEHTQQANKDFFGFLVPQDNAATVEDYSMKLDAAVLKRVNGAVTPEVAETLGMPGMETAAVTKTMGRSSTRTMMVQMYALSKGMPMKDVLSPAPELREQKEAIGREFMELISVKGSEEFYAENGKDADYRAYFADKSQKVYDMFKDIHKTIGEIPFDYFKGSSPQDLMERYEEWSFAAAASQDIFQCCPEHVKNINFDELEGLEQKVRSIGELRIVEDYCKEYVASETYAKANLALPGEDGRLIRGLNAKVNAERLVADTRQAAKLGDLCTVLDETWSLKGALLYTGLASTKLNPEGAREISDYLERDGRPIHYFDDKTQLFVVGTADSVEKALREKQTPAGPKRETVSFKDLDDTKKNRAIKPHDRQKAPQKAPMQKKGPQMQ